MIGVGIFIIHPGQSGINLLDALDFLFFLEDLCQLDVDFCQNARVIAGPMMIKITQLEVLGHRYQLMMLQIRKSGFLAMGTVSIAVNRYGILQRLAAALINPVSNGALCATSTASSPPQKA